jgi:hypothetical protein
MLNHYRPRETKWAFDGARRAFTITSLQPIGAGAQVGPFSPFAFLAWQSVLQKADRAQHRRRFYEIH